MTNYVSTLRLAAPLDTVRSRVEQALAEEGFGVLTVIDVAQTLRKKLGVAMEDYVILGACNPRFAHRALTLEVDVGALLPCNVVLRREGTATVVAMVRPSVAMAMSDNAQLAELAQTVEAALARVAARLQA